MKKRLMSVVMMAAILVSLLIGVVSVSAAEKITFSLWDEVQMPVFETLIASFMEANPDIEVEIQLTPWGQYWTKLDAAAGAGEAPDVFWMNTYLPKYTDAGILEPLDPYIDNAGLDRAAWSETMLKAYADNGVQFAMPKGMDVVVLAYNKNIFDKYAIAYPESGWTWDDFVAKGAELRDAIAAAGGSEYAAAIEVDEPQPSYLQLLAQDGFAMFTDEGTGTDLDNPDAAKAFADLVGLMDEKIIPEYKVLSDTKATDLFLSEKAGMLYVGSWKSSVLDEVSFADKIGLVTLPSREKSLCLVGGLGYSMSAFSENKDAAWKLIEFLSGPESNKVQAEARIDIPAYIAEQSAYIPSFKNIDGQVFIDAAASSVPFPSHRPLGQTLPVMMEYAAKIFSQEMTPEDGAAEMAAKIIEAVEDYKIEMQ